MANHWPSKYLELWLPEFPVSIANDKELLETTGVPKVRQHSPRTVSEQVFCMLDAMLVVSMSESQSSLGIKDSSLWLLLLWRVDWEPGKFWLCCWLPSSCFIFCLARAWLWTVESLCELAPGLRQINILFEKYLLLHVWLQIVDPGYLFWRRWGLSTCFGKSES